MTFLGLIAAGVAWYLLLTFFPKYTAKTFIRILPPVEKDPMVIGAVQVQKDIQYGYRVSMANLLSQQSTLSALIDRSKVRETTWFQRFGQIRERRIVKAVEDLEDNFAANPQRDGEFVVVSMTCGAKAEAALIVNEMVGLFLDMQGGRKRAEIADRLGRLTQQQDSVQRDLDLAEQALADVRTATGLTDLEEGTGTQFRHTIELRLDDLQLQQTDLVLEIRQAQADIGNLEKLAVGFINEQVEDLIERDPTTAMLTQQVALQEAQLAGLLTKFGENHRELRQMRELINEIRKRRRLRRAEIAEQTRQANFKNAQDRLIVLQERYAELEKLRHEAEAKKRDLDLARIQYQQRVTIRDERKQMLDLIKEQIEKLRIVREDPETPKVQFVGYAPEPLRVSSPRWQLYFPGGTILGLMFGVGLAFLIELLNDLVRTPRDVSRYLHIPLLGVIPDAAEDDQIRGVDLGFVVSQAPYSIISESYRRFRTNLKLSSSAESLKTLLVTGGAAGDGKTSVAVNLAMTFVAEDRNVLLIDANFWRPSLHTMFPAHERGTENQNQQERSEFGLSTLLSGLCGYQEIIRASDVEGLSVIDSGPLPSNPAELLGGPQMEQLVKHQRQTYDYVIVDGPPVLLVSAAKILAKVVDGTVLVFNANMTRRGAALRTIRELREINATVVGCVLLAVRAMKGGYFAESFRSYQEYQKLQLAHSV
jgi:capsular exopolysaccharide synthesis family protein